MEDKILVWAEDKGLTSPELVGKQYNKLLEEVGELGSALIDGDRKEQIDAIGDIQVVLIILAKKLGLNYSECLEFAYDEIKERTGKTVNGVFIKNGK